MPRAHLLPPPDEIRSTISLSTLNQAESQLLKLAFGPGFNFAQLNAISELIYKRQITRASEKLNGWLQKVFRSHSGLAFDLIPDTAQRDKLSISLRDAHGGLTPLGSRGAGVRRVMTLLTALMANDYNDDYHVILVDEPEASLHADSQHLVRSLLESLGAQPRVQVIYATHSPSMVNVLRPHNVRLLERKRVEATATSIVANRPFEGGFQPVRASLGITPADSLLYAPVAIVVEGHGGRRTAAPIN